MEITRFINKKQREVLAKARATYGDTAQILVSTEELCELAAVCSKYPRYQTKAKAQDELHDKAVDEVADVLIVLDHVISIFGLTPVDIGDRIAGKVARLERWLNTSNSMEQTTVDRKVPGQLHITEMRHEEGVLCDKCTHREGSTNFKPSNYCAQCLETDGGLFEPIEEE